MKNGLSSIGAEETIVTLIRTEGFNQLSDENKQMIITTLQDSKDKEKEGGFMGKMFGTRKENASMHIAFFLCCILLLMSAIDMIHAMYMGM